jgi:hypothetical protein
MDPELECPPLYEVEICVPFDCEEDSPFSSAVSSSRPQQHRKVSAAGQWDQLRRELPPTDPSSSSPFSSEQHFLKSRNKLVVRTNKQQDGGNSTTSSGGDPTKYTNFTGRSSPFSTADQHGDSTRASHRERQRPSVSENTTAEAPHCRCKLMAHPNKN